MAQSWGMRMVMAPNGTLVTAENAAKLVESGIKRVSISLDGADAQRHDRFRGVAGAFEGALRGNQVFQSCGNGISNQYHHHQNQPRSNPADP